MCAQSFVIPHKTSVPLTDFKNLSSPGLNPSPLFYSPPSPTATIQCRYPKCPLKPRGAFVHLDNFSLSAAWQSRSCCYAHVNVLSLPGENHGIINLDPFATCLGGGNMKWGIPHTSVPFCTDCFSGCPAASVSLLVADSGRGPPGGFLFPA